MSWKLLSETRRRCFRVVWPGVAACVALVLLQTVSGKLGPTAPSAWLWIGAFAMLPLVVLWLAVLLNRQAARLVSLGVHMSLAVGSALYYLLAFATLLLEPLATQREGATLEDYYRLSAWWMTPFALLLLAGYALVFFGPAALFRIKGGALQTLIRDKAAQAAQSGNTRQQQYLAWVAENQLPAVFARLREEQPAQLNDAILLESQYNQLVRDRQLNFIDPETAERQRVRIVAAVLDLVVKL